jgi:hypothetical protein
VGAQPPGDQLGEQLDLEVQALDQPQQRVDAGPGLRRQSRRAQQFPPTRAEQISHRHLHASGRQDRVDLTLQARAKPDQLRPMPHPAAQLPRRRRRDPRLRQPTHPQQIGKIRGVALVVLHPPI